MDGLPNELIDKILSYLDGPSLARSVCVCRTWRGLHEQNHYNSLWKHICLTDFAPEALSDITGYSLNKSRNNLDCELVKKENLLNLQNVNWKEVYKECYRSWFIGKWPSLGTELKGHSGRDIF